MTGYDKALSAYRDAQDQQHMSGAEIYSELLKGIISNLYKMKDAFQEEDIPKVLELSDKTSQIVTALRSALDFDKEPEASRWLQNLYLELTLRLSKIFRVEDKEQHCDDMIELVKPVYERWADFAKKQN